MQRRKSSRQFQGWDSRGSTVPAATVGRSESEDIEGAKRQAGRFEAGEIMRSRILARLEESNPGYLRLSRYSQKYHVPRHRLDSLVVMRRVIGRVASGHILLKDLPLDELQAKAEARKRRGKAAFTVV